jgi:Cu+-exporting ATPase
MQVKDPVCGMMIEQSEAVATSQYQGTTYYFCGQDCKAKFDRAPEQYATKG